MGWHDSTATGWGPPRSSSEGRARRMDALFELSDSVVWSY